MSTSVKVLRPAEQLRCDARLYGSRPKRASSFSRTDAHYTAANGAEAEAEKATGSRATHGRVALRYTAVAVGCVLFTLIYAQFSHGVYSSFMTFMFAIPLVGGALPALGLRLANARPVPRVARQSWALAIASLTVASCLRGVFEIAGTGSVYLAVYLVAALGFAIAAIVSLARGFK